MAKRSTNFTGRKPMRASHVLSLMEWVGMSDAEIRAALEEQKQVAKSQNTAQPDPDKEEGKPD